MRSNKTNNSILLNSVFLGAQLEGAGCWLHFAARCREP